MGVLEGKVAIVTGGGRGIGRAAVESMVREGAKVLVNDVGVNKDGTHPDSSVAEQLASELRSKGGKIAANASDISTWKGAKEMVKACLDAFGTVDILYNNAGVALASPLVTKPEEYWNKVLGVHVKGMFYCTKEVLPVMIGKRSGVILNTSSPGALWGSPNLSDYGAAKGAIHSFTLVLYKEVYEHGIRVNTIVPGADTGRHDPKETAVREQGSENWIRVGSLRTGDPLPHKVGPVVAYLCSDECADITGRTIFAGADQIAYYKDMEPTRQLFNEGGWTIPALQKLFHHCVLPGPPHYYCGNSPPPPAPTPGSLNPERLLEGKVAIITGGGRGIGRAAAFEFARLGAKLLINDYGVGYDSKTPESNYAVQVAKEINSGGGKAVFNTASVADKDGARSIIDDCLKAYGTIDILYNNAGFATWNLFKDIDEETWDFEFEANLTGTYNCTKAALPIMIENKRGHIINTSSPGGLWGSPMNSAYGTAKGGITAFTRCVYKEVYESGITVNNLVPGAATLRDHSLRAKGEVEARKWVRVGSVSSGQPLPERVAPITAYIASDECNDITGRTIFAAGNTLAVYSDPVLENHKIMEGGWTIEGLRRNFRAVVPQGPPSGYLGDKDPGFRKIADLARMKAK